MTNSYFALLGVNSGVENRILSYVASGDGGLRDVLNLRLVCTTTRSWVDNLPKPQADIVFAKGQVVMDYTEKDLSKFLLSPPPFGVTSLSFKNENKPINKTTAARFRTFWNSKLKTLELQPRPNHLLLYPFNLHLLGIMESPNLARLQIDHPFFRFRIDSRLSSCFRKVTELRISSRGFQETCRTKLFLQLENNNNLRVFSVNLQLKEDFLGITKLINNKKDDAQLQFTLDLIDNYHQWDSQDDRQVLREFIDAIVSSKSKIRIVNLYDLRDFKKSIEEVVSVDVCLDLFRRIESVERWTPSEDTLSLLLNLPRLSKLNLITISHTYVDIKQVAFPPSLEHLGINRGLPNCEHLPQSLTSFSLTLLFCYFYPLLTWLDTLRCRCPQLDSLHVTINIFQSLVEREDVNFGTALGFSSLRQLTIRGCVVTDHVQQDREAFTDLFDFRNLELNYLNLGMRYKNGKHNHPWVDVQMLTDICEGQSSKSIQQIVIQDECVTPEAIPLLEKLRSLAGENLKKQNEKQGQTRRNRKNEDLQ